MTHLEDDPHGTRENLIQAGLYRFAKYGYEATPIRLVAARAGKNTSLISYYFKGKEGLYRAVLQTTLDRYSAPVPPALPDSQIADPGQGRARLQAWIDQILLESDRYAHEGDPARDAAARIWLSELHAPRPEILDILKSHMEPVNQELRACVQALRPDLGPDQIQVWAAMIRDLCFGRTLMAEVDRLLWPARQRRPSREALAETLLSFVLAGLQAVPPASK